MRAIALIGPPACGKGTQAEKLTEKLNLNASHISTGDLIRKRLNDFSGAYIDDNVIKRLIYEEIKENPADLYILDGVPRTLGQVSIIDELFNLEQLFYFTGMSRGTIEKRISDRGRGEDSDQRIMDYIEKSSPVPEYFSMYRPEIFYRIEGENSPEDINNQILRVIDK